VDVWDAAHLALRTRLHDGADDAGHAWPLRFARGTIGNVARTTEKAIAVADDLPLGEACGQLHLVLHLHHPKRLAVVGDVAVELDDRAGVDRGEGRLAAVDETVTRHLFHAHTSHRRPIHRRAVVGAVLDNPAGEPLV